MMSSAMDCNMQFGFVETLRVSLRMLIKSGRLMSIIVSFTLLLYSLFCLLNFFSIKPLLTDLIISGATLPITSPNTSDFFKLLHNFKTDVGFFFGLQWVFYLLYFLFSLFSKTATIFVVALIFCKKSLTSEDVVSRVQRSWTRPLITWFYTTIFNMGYILFILGILIPPKLIFDQQFTSTAISIVLGVVALIFSVYLSVVWLLAMVASVLEEGCYGIEALGKAAMLVKGNRVHGFVLNCIFTVLYLIVLQGMRMIAVIQSQVTKIIIMLLVVNFTCLVEMLRFITFTVLYFHCKKTQGEEIELEGGIEYNKLPPILPVNQDIP